MVFRVAGTGAAAISSYQGYYGSFFSDQDQSDGVDTPTAFTLNNTAEAVGVSISNNSRVVFANAGTYNIQFSAQVHHVGGGGAGETLNIWFRKNGVDIANSDTKVTVTSSTKYVVPAWNFIVTVTAGQYIELYFKTDNASIVFEAEAASANSPAIPSLILTAQQIR